MYTIKKHLLNSNKCDDNRTYTLRRTSKANSFVTKKSNPTEMKARIIHKNSRGKYFSKEMVIRTLVIYKLLRDIIVEIKAYLHHET